MSSEVLPQGAGYGVGGCPFSRVYVRCLIVLPSGW